MKLKVPTVLGEFMFTKLWQEEQGKSRQKMKKKVTET